MSEESKLQGSSSLSPEVASESAELEALAEDGAGDVPGAGDGAAPAVDYQYQGSQAFAQLTASNESVSRGTGSLQFGKTLTQLEGVVPSMGLRIDLVYTPSSQGVYGLPQNWAFSTSYIILETAGGDTGAITSNGRNYILDPGWKDITQYQSGFKYINNHALNFVKSPGPIPSHPDISYTYKFKQQDGSLEYYDDQGKLLFSEDIFGNFIQYTYNTGPGPSATTAQLQNITDTWGLSVTFNYVDNGNGNGTITVVNPDTSQSVITYSQEGVTSITDVMGTTTTFAYIDVEGKKNLKTIVYPTGLITQFEYTSIPYRDNAGDKQMPVVYNHFHTDGAGSILDYTRYAYGTGSNGNSFTGFTVQGCVIGGLTDGLIDTAPPTYRYDTLIQRFDMANLQLPILLAATRTTYNPLHSPVSEENYRIDPNGGLLNGFQSIYSYDDANQAKSVNYTQPINTEQLRSSIDGKTWLQLRATASAYDDYGSLLSLKESIWDTSSGKYVEQTEITKTYQWTKLGNNMLKTQSYKDLVANTSLYEKNLVYNLTADEKHIESSVLQYKSTAKDKYSPWKTKAYTYDEKGRFASERVSWSEGAPAPPDTVQAYGNQISYSVTSPGVLVMAETDAVGNVITSTYDMRKTGGPLVSKRAPMGQLETFNYDFLGRITSYVDPLGNTSFTEYTVTNQPKSPGNTVTTKSPLQYVTTKNFDPLGREISLFDNGDPTAPVTQQPPPVSRQLSQTLYDSMSRKIKTTNEVGLSVTFDKYDSFSRLLSSTDYDGNNTTYNYNEETLVVESYMNGDIRESVYLDGFARKIKHVAYPDSENIASTFNVISERVYGGFGDVISLQMSEEARNPAGSPVIIGSVSRTYNVESIVLSEESKGQVNNAGGAGVDTLTRRFTFDIFGNVFTYHKKVKYVDGSKYDHKGTKNFYDEAGRLIKHEDQLENIETFHYDTNSQLISLRRFDGSSYYYSYDLNGRMTQVSYGDNSQARNFSYLPNGKLQSVWTGIDQSTKVTYDYYLDGSSKSVSYPDGKTEIYTLDKCSRVVTQTDVFGVQRTNEFDPTTGRIMARTCGNEKVEYTYREINHTKSQFVSDTTKGARIFSRTLTYDGFGRANSIKYANPEQIRLFEAVYLFDSRGRLTNLEMKSDVNSNRDINSKTVLKYDGLDQLEHEDVTYKDGSKTTTYKYDGNSNILFYGITEQTKDKKLTSVDERISEKNFKEQFKYRYNAINQRVEYGPEGKFKYSKNGNLLQDDAGRKYEYNRYDQLLAASTHASKKHSTFVYRPDDTLSSYVYTNGPDKTETDFWYDVGAVNASHKKHNGTDVSQNSYLLEPGRRVLNNSGIAKKYYIDCNGSTVMFMNNEGTTSATAYGAYGNTEDPSSEPPDDFLYRQEFTDQASGLVYMRSRYYQPSNWSFLTMDSRQTENRYAYCDGDPINNFDGTGHFSFRDALKLIVGMVVGAAVTFVVGAFVGAIAGSVFGASSVVSSIVGSAVGGGVGTLASDYAQAFVGGESLNFSAGRIAGDLLGGALAGALGKGIDIATQNAIAGISNTASKNMVKMIRFATNKLVTDKVNKGVQAAVTSLIDGSGDDGGAATTANNVKPGSVAGGQTGISETGGYTGPVSNFTLPIRLFDADYRSSSQSSQSFDGVRKTPPYNGSLFNKAPQNIREIREALVLVENESEDATKKLFDMVGPLYETVAPHSMGNVKISGEEGKLKGGNSKTATADQGKGSGKANLTDKSTRSSRAFGGFTSGQAIADALNDSCFAMYALSRPLALQG